MAGETIPHYHNTEGHRAIEISAREFMCVGALPPDDHPHVFLDMGDETEKVCPYCSTLYRYNPKLARGETDPADCLFAERAA
ncbi:zinc-finger domain-containing protein [Aquibium sp. A9E412]|uniref:zinc-finger domain-containing protein n=1 Tax=Aquibium sp. A9E412 TaxID=2976767 RepID=UPI0025B0AD82|nr:zinc-finger domain-containing protein [Aquibium sp. A9E412]MDN2564981.1 zinc-finger domain-containing protein [Aquibium sp. A9E412]